MSDRCGDSGGKGKTGRFCAAKGTDEDGRCNWHPKRADPIAVDPEEERLVQELLGNKILPPPDDPFLVAREIGEPVRPSSSGGMWVYDGGVWWCWDSGKHWREAERQEVYGWLYQETGNAVFPNPKTNQYALWSPNKKTVEYLEHALSNSVLSSYSVPGFRDGGGRVVSMSNGVLNVDEMSLSAHTPMVFNKYYLPHKFQDGAEEPTEWLKFLKTVFDGDDESVDLIRLWFCAVLLGVTKNNVMLWLLGPTRSGKGVIAGILEKLIGEMNMAQIDFTRFGEVFGMERAVGKMLLTDRDVKVAGGGHQATVSMLLKLVANETVSIQRKGKPDWVGQMNALAMFLSNDMPPVHDPSKAFAARCVIARTRRSFLGPDGERLPEYDENLPEKLAEELPEILYWAISAKDLLERDGLREPASSKTDRDTLKLSSSEVSEWVSDMCVLEPGAEVPMAELRQACNDWRREQGTRDTRDLSAVTFGKQLRAIPGGGDITKAQRGRWPDRVEVYVGVRFKTAEEHLLD